MKYIEKGLPSIGNMANSIKGENKLEGVSNYWAWKKRRDLILEKHKLLNLVQGKFKKPTDEANKEKFRETKILAMNLIVDGVT